MAFGVVATWLVMLAAATDTGLGPYAQIANYGILGLIALALFQGRIVPAKQYDEMKEDRDRARGELVSLRQRIDEQMLPAIIRSTDLLTRLAERND